MVPARRPRESTARSTPPTAALVELGRIVNRHAVRGEVRVQVYNPDSDALLVVSSVLLTRPDGETESRRVLGSRRHKRFALLRLEGVATADEAEGLIGCAVSVPRDQLPPAGPAAVYHADLLGCAVRTTAGVALGTVGEMLVTGSNDVCVVRDGAREVLIPLVADVIAELDLRARVIVVRPIPGLLED